MSETNSERKAVSANEAREYPSVHQQMIFGDDGGIEPEEGSIGTSLTDFGAEVDHRERETRIDRPAANEFGVDDRPEVTHPESGEQGALFASVDENQRTLDDEQATGRSLF